MIANPNSNQSTTDVLVQRLQRWLTSFCPDTDIPDVVGVTVTEGPGMITTPKALTEAAAHVSDVVADAVDRHHVDSVVIGGFGDPGVDQLRALLDIPVIGIGEAAVRDASRDGLRFGIATTTGDLVGPLSEMVDRCAVTDLFTGVEITTSGPLHLASLPDATRRELADAVRQARARGANKVIVGGGPLSGAADYLEQLFPGVIVDPVSAAARWAEKVTRPQLIHHQNHRGIQ